MANQQNRTVVQIKPILTRAVQHPIKAARLLYTPPSYILRGPIYLVFLITMVALLYSFWAKKDTLVMAPLSLSKSSLVVQSIGGGMVTSIIAREGTPVNSGEPLVMIQEQTRISMTPERERLEKDKFDLIREREKAEEEYNHSASQLQLDLKDIETGKKAERVAGENRVRQIEEQLTTAERARERQQGRLALARTRFARTKAQFDQHDLTLTQFEQAQETVYEAEKALDDTEAQIAEVKIALQTAKADYVKLQDLNRKEKLESELRQLHERQARDMKRYVDRIAGIDSKLKAEEELVESVKYRDNLAEYKSNFDGLITRIHVTPGQIIGAGTPLVTIIKQGSPLEGHAFVDNKDIGHLQKGQDVKLKYYAYPYQEYGIAEGRIADIATNPSGLPGKESKYLVKIALVDQSISKLGTRPKPLELGLEGIAEIKTGEKRFIELLFSPVSRFFTPEEEV